MYQNIDNVTIEWLVSVNAALLTIFVIISSESGIVMSGSHTTYEYTSTRLVAFHFLRVVIHIIPCSGEFGC